jgi:ammonium transporter, Amt family
MKVYDGGDFTLLGIQLLGILWISSWISIVMGSFFFILNFLGWFRIDPLEEEVGLDISRHKGPAFDHTEGGAKEEHVMQLSNSRHGGRAKIVEAEAEEDVKGTNGDD